MFLFCRRSCVVMILCHNVISILCPYGTYDLGLTSGTKGQRQTRFRHTARKCTVATLHRQSLDGDAVDIVVVIIIIIYLFQIRNETDS